MTVAKLKSRLDLKLTPRQRLVLEYVREHGRTNPRELRSVIKDSMSIVYSTIKSLILRGLVQPVYTFGTVSAYYGKTRTIRMLTIEPKER